MEEKPPQHSEGAVLPERGNPSLASGPVVVSLWRSERSAGALLNPQATLSLPGCSTHATEAALRVKPPTPCFPSGPCHRGWDGPGHAELPHALQHLLPSWALGLNAGAPPILQAQNIQPCARPTLGVAPPQSPLLKWSEKVSDASFALMWKRVPVLGPCSFTP